MLKAFVNKVFPCDGVNNNPKNILLVFLFLLVFTTFFKNPIYAQWHQLKQPFKADVNCIFNHNQEIFIGTGGGIYSSTDNGQNWYPRNNGLLEYRIYDIGNINDILFACTENGVFRSFDNGLNWEYCYYVQATNGLTAMAIKDSLIFVGNYLGRIWKSSNLGNSWTKVYHGLLAARTYQLIVHNGSIYGAKNGEGVVVSHNDGATWDTINNGISNPSIHSITFLDHQMFIADEYQGVFTSNVQNVYWTAVNNGINDYSTITLNNIDGMIFAGTKNGNLYRSSDFGSSWTELNNNCFDSEINALVSIKEKIYAGIDADGVYKSGDNGESWTMINNGLSNTHITSIIEKDNLLFMSFWNHGIYVSNDGGKTCTQISDDIPAESVLCLSSNNTTIFAGTLNNGVYRSFDNGQSWEECNNGINTSYLITHSIYSQNETIFICIGSFYVYRSTDNGDTWVSKSAGLYDNKVMDFEISNNIILAGTQNDGIYRSTNNGDSWVKVLGNPHKIRDFCKWENEFYAATCYGGIVFSEDGGISWSIMNNNLPYTEVQTITHTGFRLVAGLLYEGFYEYKEGASTWEAMNQGMNLESIEIECLFAKNNKLYAGTDDFGLWYCPYQVFAERDIAPSPTTKNILSFDSDNGTIHFISDFYHNRAVIKVITLSGKIVYNETLYEKQPKKINTSILKPGVYLICIESGETIQTKKIFIH